MAHPLPIADVSGDDERSLLDFHAQNGRVPECYERFANRSARAALRRLREQQERFGKSTHQE